ncbi:MAG: hypothetical protein IJ386_06485 [Clostridia bacterium]|nr:hypothetical protein [Clostridia bacterium]
MERFKKWFDNFWYHYKWHTIIIIVFAVTFAIGFGQIAFEKNNYDVYALYAGPTYLEKIPHDEIVETFKKEAEKISGDTESEKDVNLQMLIYLTDDQIAAQKEYVESQGETFVFDYLENNNVFDTFMKQLVSGENVIMFLDPMLYETAEKNEALYKIKDILGRDVPGLTDSGMGVRLAESGLEEKYPCLSALPDDCVVCFRKVTHAMKLIGKSESQDSHKFQLDLARELFSGIE